MVRPFLNFVVTLVVTLVIIPVAVVVVAVGLRTVVREMDVLKEADFLGEDDGGLVVVVPVEDLYLVLIETLSFEEPVDGDGKCVVVEVVVVARATVFVLNETV